jgi:outer membrane receptor protein involved in Fe transport
MSSIFKRMALTGAAFGALGLMGTAIAQETPAADEPVTTTPQTEGEARQERVVITGSRIARDNTTSSAPLIQVDREAIAASGEPNVVDFLADIPALQTSTVPEDTTGANLNDGGLSLLDLRGLGAVRTLVLVDGRRHVGSAPGALSVDVDTIPSPLVERIEVTTGGQSAVYGADAIGGVVNFILRKDYEGAELDLALSEINQDGQMATRISGVVGRNFLNDRLNLYAFGEYQDVEEVLDFDIDWKRSSTSLVGNDADPISAPVDGDLDNIVLGNLRDAFFARGGVLVISNQPRPSPAADPDTPFQNCGAAGSGALPGNCTAIRADQPGTVFTFGANGAARPFNFGTQQPQTGFSRRLNVGGDGLNTGTEFGQGTRVPASESMKFQAGFNFDLLENLQLFGEAKYVDEETFDSGQPSFFQITLRNGVGQLTGSSTFLLGLDNAFLNSGSPGLVSQISANTRPVFDVNGVQTGTIADPRAFLGIFGPSRSQLNNRTLERYVVGARGDFEQLGFVKDFNWEVGYTYGQVENSNLEVGVDSERFFYASDSVVDTNNVTGRGAGSVVCRVQVQTANGATIPVPLSSITRTGGAALSASDPAIAGCVPISLFGTDFRSDANHPNATGGGGRQGLTQAQADYVLAAIEVTDENRQQNFLAFGTGELWDLWGAGPLAFAAGYEFRREETEGTGRDRGTAGRLLFLNTGPDFPVAKYDANEVFAEVRVPLLKEFSLGGFSLAKYAEISGAFRRSDYSTAGEVDTWSVQAQWTVNDHLYLRATNSFATRIPNLSENFRPPTQTFGNGLVDPCDANRIRAQTALSPEQRNRLRANCVATLPAGYDPGSDTPNTGTTITYTSGIPGFNSGNLLLEPETADSITAGFAFTPKFADWMDPFYFTADYYEIDMEQVIAAVAIQAALNNCVGILTNDIGSVNQGACSTFQRSAAPQIGQQPPFGIFTFIQTSVNFAGQRTRGVDFTSGYTFDAGKYGDINVNLAGNWLIQQTQFNNIANPTQPTDLDDFVGLPRVRFLSTVTYSPSDKLSFSWDWDWQSSQELIDESAFAANSDTRLESLIRTEAFSQHDFSARWQPRDNVTIRAGVVNAFDNEPDVVLGAGTSADNFDFFGRRLFVGANLKF